MNHNFKIESDYLMHDLINNKNGKGKDIYIFIKKNE